MEHAYARARELCRQVGETPQLFQALFGLWGFYEAQGELQTALELGEQLLTLAQRVPDPALLLEAHHALGATLFWRGEVPPAGAHFAQGIALYDPQHHRSLAWLYGEDPGSCADRMPPGPSGSLAIRTRPSREPRRPHLGPGGGSPL